MQRITCLTLTERHTVLGVGRHAAPHDKMEVGTCMLLDFQAGSAAGIHNPRLGYNRMRKQGERGGAELRLAPIIALLRPTSALYRCDYTAQTAV